MVYKKRAGTTEGLAYPMSVTYLKTQFGNVFIIPANEQACPAGNTVNNSKLAFVYDPTATEIVWKLRFEPKDLAESTIADEVVLRGVFAIAGILPNHIRMISHVRQT